MTDTRIVYGARCTWFDSIDKAYLHNGKSGGLPVCPNCGSPLLEQDEKDWWAQVDAYTKFNDPNYRKFIEWLRGKCFKSYPIAYAAYDKEIH